MSLSFLFNRRIKFSASVNLPGISKSPYRALPIADVPAVITNRAPTHYYSIVIGIKVGFDYTRAGMVSGINTIATIEIM